MSDSAEQSDTSPTEDLLQLADLAPTPPVARSDAQADAPPHGEILGRTHSMIPGLDPHLEPWSVPPEVPAAASLDPAAAAAPPPVSATAALAAVIAAKTGQSTIAEPPSVVEKPDPRSGPVGGPSAEEQAIWQADAAAKAERAALRAKRRLQDALGRAATCAGAVALLLSMAAVAWWAAVLAAVSAGFGTWWCIAGQRHNLTGAMLTGASAIVWSLVSWGVSGDFFPFIGFFAWLGLMCFGSIVTLVPQDR